MFYKPCYVLKQQFLEEVWKVNQFVMNYVSTVSYMQFIVLYLK